MSRRACRRLLSFALAVLLTTSAGHAQDAETTSELTRIRGEIAGLRTRLSALDTRQASLAKDLEATEIRIAIAQRELELLTEAETTLAQERQALVDAIAALEVKLDRQKRLVSRRLDALYRMGNMGYLRMLLSVSADSNPLDAVSMLGYLASRDGREFERMRTLSADLDRQRAELDDRSTALLKVNRDAAARGAALTAERSRQKALLAKLEGETERSSARLVQLEEKAKRLERLLDLLYTREQGVLAARDVREFRGVLPWPVEGKVIVPFGRQRSENFATFTMNNGIRIGAAENTEVRAVFAGTVLYAQWFRGYGNLVILDHGNRVFSLYANTRMSTVNKEDQVQAGQVIATVAGGEAEELPPHLYFEIREDNRPVDPRGWIR